MANIDEKLVETSICMLYAENIFVRNALESKMNTRQGHVMLISYIKTCAVWVSYLKENQQNNLLWLVSVYVYIYSWTISQFSLHWQVWLYFGGMQLIVCGFWLTPPVTLETLCRVWKKVIVKWILCILLGKESFLCLSC